MTAVTDCTKDIEVISKMYLVQFINPATSLIAIHAVMSQKFGFACNASGVRPGAGTGEGGRAGQAPDVSIGISKPAFDTGSSQSSYWSR